MKNKILITGLIIILLSLRCIAQDNQSITKVHYRYTFEGMKDSTETTPLIEAAMKLEGVVLCEVIFKSSEHKYALLRVDVIVPGKTDENYGDITGPPHLKKLLCKFGYIPNECKTIYEN